MQKAKVTTELLERVIARDPAAVRTFVAILEPVFRVRIGRVLIAAGDASRRDVDDLCQDTFIALLAHNGRLARSWDRSRGMSFENFSGVIAKQRAIASLRKRREEVWLNDDPCEQTEPMLDSSRTPERRVASHELLRRVLEIQRAELSVLGQKLFDLLFVEEREVDEVCAIMRMNKEAVYAWRSRLGRRIEEIAATMGDAE